MPRPPKIRHVCCLPKSSSFSPAECDETATIFMTVDEYETIRLIDLEDCTQADCAEQMNVARTTVQGIYNDARKKLADAIVNGKRLSISGGDYLLCSHSKRGCKRGCKKRCPKHL